MMATVQQTTTLGTKKSNLGIFSTSAVVSPKNVIEKDKDLSMRDNLHIAHDDNAVTYFTFCVPSQLNKWMWESMM